MGLQSARLYFQGKDHSGIAMKAKDMALPYNHTKMYKGNQLLWERMPASIVAINDNSGPLLADGVGSYISTSNDLEHFEVMQYGISIPGLNDKDNRNAKISQIITFAGHFVCSYRYKDAKDYRTYSLLLRSEDGYTWKTIEDFYTSNVAWIGKHIVDGEECLAAFTTGTPGAMNADIIGYYYDSGFKRKKYSYIDNFVGDFSIGVQGYNTLYIWVLNIYGDYKIAVENGNNANKIKLSSLSSFPTRIYNYEDNFLYAVGRTEGGNLAMIKKNFADETIDTYVYEIGVNDSSIVSPCYSDKQGMVIQVEHYEAITVFAKINNNKLVEKTEIGYEHVQTSNGVSLLSERREGIVLNAPLAMTDDIFGGKIRDIEINTLSEMYQKRADRIQKFAYLKQQ